MRVAGFANCKEFAAGVKQFVGVSGCCRIGSNDGTFDQKFGHFHPTRLPIPGTDIEHEQVAGFRYAHRGGTDSFPFLVTFRRDFLDSFCGRYCADGCENGAGVGVGVPVGVAPEIFGALAMRMPMPARLAASRSENKVLSTIWLY